MVYIELYTVWTNGRIGVREKCLLNQDGDYIGIETGNRYDQKDHYHSSQIKGKIISVDDENLTGMYHLFEGWNSNDENKKSTKRKYIGCYVTLEEAHYADGLRIFRCLEVDEYFSENEVAIAR